MFSHTVWQVGVKLLDSQVHKSLTDKVHGHFEGQVRRMHTKFIPHALPRLPIVDPFFSPVSEIIGDNRRNCTFLCAEILHSPPAVHESILKKDNQPSSKLQTS